MIPKINSTTSLSLLLLSFLVIATGFFVEYIQLNIYAGNIILNTGFMLGQLVGLTILFQEATITNTKYWKVIQFFFGIVLIGVLFQALEWPGSTFLLLLPFTGITVTYIIRFVAKKEKGHLDILKFIWVLMAYSCVFLIKLHWIQKEWLYLAHALFWLTIIDFIVMSFKSNKHIKILQ